MKAKRTRAGTPPPPSPPSAEVAPGDRDALAAAYRAGTITAWKRDPERGYRVSVAGRADDYVETGQLAQYLARLAAR